MKVYIIGKVTGLDYEECCKMFEEREKELKQMGHEVVNPVEIVPEGTPWLDALRICVKQLVDCDAFTSLPNSLYSRGGLLELFVARELKLKEI